MEATNGYTLEPSDKEVEKFEDVVGDIQYLFNCQADGFKRQEIMEALEKILS